MILGWLISVHLCYASHFPFSCRSISIRVPQRSLLPMARVVRSLLNLLLSTHFAYSTGVGYISALVQSQTGMNNTYQKNPKLHTHFITSSNPYPISLHIARSLSDPTVFLIPIYFLDRSKFHPSVSLYSSHILSSYRSYRSISM